MLQLEPGMIIWTWVTFFVLLFILKKVGWGPLLGAVEERESLISDSLKRAEEARAEAEKSLELQQKQLAKTQEEVQSMLRESKELAEKMRTDIVARAREDAGKMIERAKSDIEKERQAAMLSLRKEVADLVIGATSNLLREAIDEKKHRQLIDESIKSFSKELKN